MRHKLSDENPALKCEIRRNALKADPELGPITELNTEILTVYSYFTTSLYFGRNFI